MAIDRNLYTIINQTNKTKSMTTEQATEAGKTCCCSRKKPSTAPGSYGEPLILMTCLKYLKRNYSLPP